MANQSLRVQKIYLILTLLTTLAASLIWGINTLFLLDAGLTNAEAFAANAFFTLGQLLFEVPTGVIADSRGRRMSFLLGAFTLAVSTALYLLMWQISAPFWGWALSSAVLGLGFTFFSGAVEAWLVDALRATGFTGSLESVFSKGQVVGGIAMLSGSVAGGILAQVTNLGVPYIARTVILVVTFIVAFKLMQDIGFKPERGRQPLKEMKKILEASIEHGIKNNNVRWIMLAAPFSSGVGIYTFYALQPHLLNLYGDPDAYSVAGLVAAIIAGAQIVGGMLVPKIITLFKRRTTILLLGALSSALLLIVLGVVADFALAIFIIVLWALIFAATIPVRQTYLNGLIPTKQRATVLSFDSLIGSSGGVIFQPMLGKVADIYNYSTSFMASGLISALAIPFIFRAQKVRAISDPIIKKDAPERTGF